MMKFLVMTGSNADNLYAYGYVEYQNLQSLLNDLSSHGHTVTSIVDDYVKSKKENLLFSFQQLHKIDLP